MTSNISENVQVKFLPHVLTRYCMIYFGNSSKIGICFCRINHYFEKSDVENLTDLFLFHGLLYYLSEKRIQIWGHRTNSLSGGQI